MKNLQFVLIAGVLVALDQVSKALVLKYIPLHHSIAVIPGLFNLTHVQNPGGAFGFLAGNSGPWRHWIFLGAALVALVLILYFHPQTPKDKPRMRLALAMIFGGAVGNLIDRVRFGSVVDFMDFYSGQLHWPAFNVADCGVTIGVTIFVLHIVFKKTPF
ncbi:MAG: signal peptidase II [Desulfosarcinaceae bacterium]